MLEANGSVHSAAEMHGSLCGVICAGGRSTARKWLLVQIGEATGDPDGRRELSERLHELEQEVWVGLCGMAMEFTPLLPDDSVALAERISALTLWCHGFISGLALGGLNIPEAGGQDGSEIAEIIQDFSEITQADPTVAAGDAEVDEASFVELAEYVRVGVQILYETLSQGGRVEQPPTIH
jgi:uncharacterized protein YgfB (UPF0149 family)